METAKNVQSDVQLVQVLTPVMLAMITLLSKMENVNVNLTTKLKQDLLTITSKLTSSTSFGILTKLTLLQAKSSTVQMSSISIIVQVLNSI